MSVIYVLKLKNNKYYVGKSKEPEERYQQHILGKGSEWTKKYPVVEKIEEYSSDEFGFLELATTLTYMKDHGISNVRGADYSQVELSKAQIEEIQTHINNENNVCHNCKKQGHFIASCPQDSRHVNSRPWYTRIFCCLKKHLKTLKTLKAPKIINFGKYNGYTYEDILEKDRNYCEWVLAQRSHNHSFLSFQKWCKENIT